MKTDKRIMIGIFAALIMICSDSLLGYVDPTPLGNHFLLVQGYANIALWRPIVSMALGAIGMTLYLLPLSAVFHAMKSGKWRNAFGISLAISILGWLMIHFYYGYIIYSIRYLTTQEHGAMAFEFFGQIANAFLPFVLVYSACMAISFVLYFVAVLKNKTAFPKWMSAFTPAPVAILFCIAVFCMPDIPIIWALSMSTMNLSMLVWFVSIFIWQHKQANKAVK